MHNGIYFHHDPATVRVDANESEVLGTISVSLGEDQYNTQALTITSNRALWQHLVDVLATLGVIAATTPTEETTDAHA